MTQEPRWEMKEDRWHGVATLSGGYQWVAYVEDLDSPHHSTWAGRRFESLQEAQAWCRSEIALLRQQHGPNNRTPRPPQTTPPAGDAWAWLWHTLAQELGEQRMAQIREEFMQQQRADSAGNTEEIT